MTIRLVAVGSSLGGLHALGTLLQGLPERFAASLVIAQHRRADDDSRLSELLQNKCVLPVRDAEDKEPIRPGRVYVAPPDYHLLVSRDELCLSVDAPVSWARPSIDVLFESAAYAFGPQVVAVVLTGSSTDGVEGALQVKLGGGQLIVQDPREAASPVLPEAVLERARGTVLPLDRIAGHLVALCGIDNEA